MTENKAIEIVRKEKAYMDSHAGRAQSEAFQMAINALEKQEKIKEVIENANQWSKEDAVVKAQAFCEIEAIMKESESE